MAQEQFLDKTGTIWQMVPGRGFERVRDDGTTDPSVTFENMSVLNEVWGPLTPVEGTVEDTHERIVDMYGETVGHARTTPDEQPWDAPDPATLDEARTHLNRVIQGVGLKMENLQRMGFQVPDAMVLAMRLDALIDRLLGTVEGDTATQQRIDFEITFGQTLTKILNETLQQAQSAQARQKLLRPDAGMPKNLFKP